MRQMKLLFLVLVTLGFALTPIAEANKYNPKSGKKFKLLPNQKASIKVTGFQGCVFEVMHDNEGEGKGDTDSSVVLVETPGDPGKKQSVVLTAVAPGLTTVMLRTEGESGSCNNFTAMYEVLVTPDTKSVLKQATSMLKAADKQLAMDLKLVASFFCDDVKFALDSLKEGGSSGDALDLVLSTGRVVSRFTSTDVARDVEQVVTDVWDMLEAQGYTLMEPELVGLLPGGCGPVDDLLQRLDSGIAKLDATIKKKTKSVQKAIAKQEKDSGDRAFVVISDLLGITVEVPLPIPTGEKALQPEAPPKSLKKAWTSAGRMSSSETSSLNLGGVADPEGGDVTVSLLGPNGATPNAVVSVDEDCGWEADFLGTLTPGTYVVTLSQGSQSVTFTTYVP